MNSSADNTKVPVSNAGIPTFLIVLKFIKSNLLSKVF